MPAHIVPAQADIEALAGHRFAGGEYRIAHWENVLLTGCTGTELLPDGLAHPSSLFHLPIAGAGTSIAKMFALGKAESDLSIMIESYEWEFYQPLREEIDYRVEGAIHSSQRIQEVDREYDRIQFRFDIALTTGEPVARSLVTWHYTRNTL